MTLDDDTTCLACQGQKYVFTRYDIHPCPYCGATGVMTAAQARAYVDEYTYWVSLGVDQPTRPPSK